MQTNENPATDPVAQILRDIAVAATAVGFL
jgi:hypothetical protein